jgi:hypothetical protein
MGCVAGWLVWACCAINQAQQAAPKQLVTCCCWALNWLWLARAVPAANSMQHLHEGPRRAWDDLCWQQQ